MAARVVAQVGAVLPEPFRIQLGQLRARVHNLHMGDQMSQWVAHWLEQHQRSATVDAPLDAIRVFLRDPSGEPLDDDALLGSDGNTYGSMNLALNLDGMPEDFCVDPHAVAREAVVWVKRHDPTFLPSERIRTVYAQMEQEGTLPQIPYRAARQLALRQQQRNQRRQANSPAQELQRDMQQAAARAERIAGGAEEARLAVQGLREQAQSQAAQMAELQRQANQVLEHLREGDAAVFDDFLARVQEAARVQQENLAVLAERDRVEQAQVQQRLGQVGEQIAVVGRDTTALQQELGDLRHRIEEVRASADRLQRDITETKEMREANSAGGIFRTLGIIGLQIAVALIFVGAGVAVVAADGGFKVVGSIPF